MVSERQVDAAKGARSCRASSAMDALPLRVRYREEMNCQIVHDSIHLRPGWTETYLLFTDGPPVGFASVAIAGPWKDKRTVLECYVRPDRRHPAFSLFEAFFASADCTHMEVQSNGPLVTVMLHTFAKEISTEKIVFRDALTTSLPSGIPRTLAWHDSNDRPHFVYHDDPIPGLGLES